VRGRLFRRAGLVLVFLSLTAAAVASGRHLLAMIPRRPVVAAEAETAPKPPKAVARLSGGGLLSEDGIVFESKGFPGLLPDVEADVSKASVEERRALGVFLAETPVAVARMKYVSAEDGWEALLSDGTKVLWGGLQFTREKAERLRQALDDARAKQEGGFTADLRYFEDGRILLRKL
jgi:hypothetical protein